MTAQLIYYGLVFVFGACIGSFLNVVIWRLPRGEKLNGRSHCPNCHHELDWLDLFPFFSYLFLRGRCRYCKNKISPRYWLIELIAAGLFVLAAWQYMPVENVGYLSLLRVFFVVAICITVFVIDLEHYLILDKIILPAAIIMLAFNLAADFAMHHNPAGLGSFTFSGLAGAVAAAIPFFLLWYLSKGTWMGFGDVKLVIFLGLASGLVGIGITLFLAFILGAIVGVPLVLLGRKEMSSKLPFGTFLTVATIITFFWGSTLLNWYLSLISF